MSERYEELDAGGRREFLARRLAGWRRLGTTPEEGEDRLFRARVATLAACAGHTFEEVLTDLERDATALLAGEAQPPEYADLDAAGRREFLMGQLAGWLREGREPAAGERALYEARAAILGMRAGLTPDEYLADLEREAGAPPAAGEVKRVFVFLAPSSRFGGDPVVAVLGHEPSLEEQWGLLTEHVRSHYYDVESGEPLSALLDNWAGSDFRVVRLPLLP